MTTAQTKRRRRKASGRARPLALLYVRVSTLEQSEDGASMASQRATLESFAQIHEWDTLVIEDAGVSAKSLERDGMNRALQMLSAGEADVLVAVRLDRLSRDLHDITGLLKRSVDERWALVTIHGSIDTSTAMGRAYVHMAGLFAELERGMIGERTRAGMAQKRAEGQHLGRHSVLSRETVEQVRRLRDDVGMSWPKIAQELTTQGIPTATGRSAWGVSSVQSAYRVRLVLPAKRSV